MLGGRYLSVNCPVEMSLCPMVPLVFSVDIHYPPITSNKLSCYFHNIYTVFSLKNRKDVSCSRAVSVLHEVSWAFSVASQMVPTSVVCRDATFWFDTNPGTCYAQTRLLLLS